MMFRFSLFLLIMSFSVHYVVNSDYTKKCLGGLITGKQVNVSSKIQFKFKVKRQRHGQIYKRTCKRYLLLLLLLAGDVELNPGPQSLPCSRCGQVFDRSNRLEAHQDSAVPISCQICGRLFCSDNRLAQHMRTEHRTATATGDGIINLNHTIFPNTGFHETDGYKAVVEKNNTLIRTKIKDNGSFIKVYNEELSSSFTYRDLKNLLNSILYNESSVFKINIGFGIMLYHLVEDKYKYFYVSNNTLLFDRAFTISTHHDMTAFFDRVAGIDLSERYYLQRPSSGWVLAGLPNVEIRVLRIRSTPIGVGIQLPDYIRKKRCIISLTHDNTNGHDFQDHLCFFRCLALHQKAPIHGLERPAKENKRRLEEYTGKSYEDGVDIESLTTIEIFFQVSINVYSLLEDGTCKVIRISNMKYPTLHLNLFENHFSYIKSFSAYAKKYQCSKCTRFLTHSAHLKDHVKSCQNEVVEIYRGGKYKNKSTVFEQLQSIGIDVPDEYCYDPYIITYDFEAIQVPTQETVQGRSIIAEHVPATVSICSNVPGHTNPIHHASTGDPQALVDNFVETLLQIQEAKEEDMRKTFKEVIDQLDAYCEKVETELSLSKGFEKERKSKLDCKEKNQEDEGEEEVDEVEVGRKRRKRRKDTEDTKRQCFLSTEVEVEGQVSEDERDEDEDSEMEDFIDNNELDDDGTSFYRRIDNSETTHSIEEANREKDEVLRSDISKEKLLELAERKWRWGKAIRSKFLNYIKQITVLGFNSQKYDINLIRPYLAPSIIKYDDTPKFVIKKQGGYMCISSSRFKFLDITNYLAAGTSLQKFYKAYDVSTPKESFPYEWFDSLEKLNHVGLPPAEAFKSILKKSSISTEEYEACCSTWRDKGFTTFREWVKFYNNADVIGFVQAVSKMIEFEKVQNGLDMFKDSVSLPGLTQRYLFKRLVEKGQKYFVSFSDIHKDILKSLRESLTGGPSIIFHRYQERMKTWIKGKYLCKKVIGFDANSLYLYCLAQKMCTGFYSVLEKCNGYKRSTPFSCQAIQWLEFLNRTQDVDIIHGDNFMEHRIGDYLVDGYDPKTKTVYEFYGCYWHGHQCSPKHFNESKLEKLKEREKYLLEQNEVDEIVSIWGCEWTQNPESKKQYRDPEPVDLSMDDILTEIDEDRIFGLVTIDIHVPENLIPRFSEFPPLFKNVEITLADVGEHMQEFCRSTTRRHGVKRSLISSMFAKGITILTPLLKTYRRLGLKVTNIERVIEYNDVPVFDWFADEVSHDRRLADLGGQEYEIRGASSKLKGNCGYGRTLMDTSHHTKISFTTEADLPIHGDSPFLKTFDGLNREIYEVEKQPKKVLHNLPIQIGLGVYSYAKQHMLEFWDFLNSHLDNDKYQLMEMDTDSLYIAFAEENIDDCVLEEKKTSWSEKKWDWFASEDTETLKEFEGQDIPYAQWDQRTPGKFKAEFVGDGMVALNSKVYIIWNDDKTKTSCKGVQDRNGLIKEYFLSVLNSQSPHLVENAGFIRDKNIIKTYTHDKVGMGYFYAKRKVLNDGVSTTHLDI